MDTKPYYNHTFKVPSPSYLLTTKGKTVIHSGETQENVSIKRSRWTSATMHTKTSWIFWQEGTRTSLWGILAKYLQTHHNHPETLDKSELKGTLQNLWTVALKRVKIRRDEERLRSCRSWEVTKEMTKPRIRRPAVRECGNSSKDYRLLNVMMSMLFL